MRTRSPESRRASLRGPSALARACGRPRIEKRARAELSESALARLEALGLIGAIDEAAARTELCELEAALGALDELLGWVESQLVERGVQSTSTSEAMS
jgi:hypothetical protein